MSASVSLPVLGDVDPRSAAAISSGSAPGRAVEVLSINADNIDRDTGYCYSIVVPTQMFGGGDAVPDGEIPCTLLEDGKILGPPGQTHALVRKWGRGSYSLWHNETAGRMRLFFSTSDNTDPQTNGRHYTLVNQPLSYANDWEHFETRRWLNHSRGRYFLRRGGERTPPPLFANLGITDVCNLKCGICGSQNMMQPVNRRHMDYRVFQMVADTIFPLLITVELNSRGEPLLHPNIADMFETMFDYGIYSRVQTNGTQFVSRKLHTLAQLSGEVSISLDATGDLFEYARAGAKWPQVDQGTRNLLKLRDRDRLAIHLYPTLTAKTLTGAEELIRWAMEVGVDRIDFHSYDPIATSDEKVPTAENLDQLKLHASKLDAEHPIRISVNYDCVKPGDPPLLRRPLQQKYHNIPRSAGTEGANEHYTCMAPVQQVDIDLDGGVCVCCMLQERKLGNALTVEAFADCWFGSEYQAVRSSLHRSSEQPLYETCRGCVARYAGGS